MRFEEAFRTHLRIRRLGWADSREWEDPWAKGQVHISINDLKARDWIAQRDPALHLKTALEKKQAALIHKVIAHYRGNRTVAAKALGLTRTCLQMKMKRFGIIHEYQNNPKPPAVIVSDHGKNP